MTQHWKYLIALLLSSIASTMPLGSNAFADEKEPKLSRKESRPGLFSALWPKSPRPTSTFYKTSAGDLMVYSESYSPNKELSLSVTYTDFPPPIRDLNPTSILNAVRSGMGGTTGKLTDFATLERTDLHPVGQSFTIEHDRHHAHVRLYLVKNRLYQVVALGTPDELAKKTTALFLESFTILDQK